MAMPQAIIGALIGALLGIGVQLGLELGLDFHNLSWLAIPIGALVGFGARLPAGNAMKSASILRGAIVALIALGGIFSANQITAHMLKNQNLKAIENVPAPKVNAEASPDETEVADPSGDEATDAIPNEDTASDGTDTSSDDPSEVDPVDNGTTSEDSLDVEASDDDATSDDPPGEDPPRDDAAADDENADGVTTKDADDTASVDDSAAGNDEVMPTKAVARPQARIDAPATKKSLELDMMQLALVAAGALIAYFLGRGGM